MAPPHRLHIPRRPVAAAKYRLPGAPSSRPQVVGVGRFPCSHELCVHEYIIYLIQAVPYVVMVY